MNDHDLETQLSSLPPPVLDPAARSRAREAGRAALPAGPSRLDRWVGHLERGYGRIEPLLALLVAVIDLRWAASMAFG